MKKENGVFVDTIIILSISMLAVAMLLLTSGALFRSLFKLNLDPSGEQETPSPCEVTWDSGDRGSAGPGA